MDPEETSADTRDADYVSKQADYGLTRVDYGLKKKDRLHFYLKTAFFFIIATHVGKEGVENNTSDFVEKAINVKIDQCLVIGL